MHINIFGSTGTIGAKSLKLINKYFPNLKIDLITANNNYKKFILQINLYKPKAVYLNNPKYSKKLSKNIPKNILILNKLNIHEYLRNTKTDLTILAISGIHALEYINSISNNTSNLGLVNKESIVSAGHLLNKILLKTNTKLFPLDSEHYSLNNFKIINKNIHKIYLTASGGPFLKIDNNKIYNAKISQVIKHPKWKMGQKNSIDSATLSNKILEIIEAKYLFNIPFNKLDIVIHPEAFIHSIIEFNDFQSNLNYFYPDMFIPIINFISKVSLTISKPVKIKKFYFNKSNQFNFYDVDKIKFPIYKLLKDLDFNNPLNAIKFNIANEHAVNLFLTKKIKFGDIYKYICEYMLIDINSPSNSIENVINIHYEFNSMLKNKYL